MDLGQIRLPPGFLLPSRGGSRRGILGPGPGKKFLKGPIPWEWLQRAGRARGHALHVAVVLWFLAGIVKCSTVKLSNIVLAGFGVDRSTAQRGLRALEVAGLITVVRHRGRQPRVTLLSVGVGGKCSSGGGRRRLEPVALEVSR
jgi:DNA-binding transcriptional ArsR family regulator